MPCLSSGIMNAVLHLEPLLIIRSICGPTEVAYEARKPGLDNSGSTRGKLREIEQSSR